MVENQKKRIATTQENQTTANSKLSSGLTVKVIIITIAVAAFIASSSVYGHLAGLRTWVDFGSWRAAPAPGAFAVLVAALLINLITRFFIKKETFSKAELYMLYWLVTIAGLIASEGLMTYLPLVIMSWPKRVMLLPLTGYGLLDRTISAPILEGFSSWVIPKSEEAAMGFWVGESVVPWAEWIMPIITWSIFFSVATFFVLCLSNLVYKQWSSVEHLTYPLTKPLFEMIGTENEQPKRESFWRSGTAIVGMIVGGVFLSGLSGLNHYFPIIPIIPLQLDVSHWYPANPMLNAGFSSHPTLFAGNQYLYIWPLTISFLYFASLDLVFSLWAVHLVQQIAQVIIVSIGGPNVFIAPGPSVFNNYPTTMLSGAYIGFLASTLYIARHQIAQIFRAVRKQGHSDDADELLSYRVTVIGGAVALVFLVAFTYVFLNLNPLISLAFFTLTAVYILGFARIRGETGLPLAFPQNHAYEYYLIKNTIGMNLMGATNVGGISFFVPFSMGNFNSIGAVTHEAAKCADENRMNKRALALGIVVTTVIVIVVSWIVMLPIHYKLGAGSYDSHSQMISEFFVRGFLASDSSAESQPYLLLPMAVGAGLTLVAMYLRSIFVWWPIHPIGIITAYLPLIPHLWPSCFLVWLLKLVVLRYGGREFYLKSQRFFIGLAVGYITVGALFSVIGMIVGY